MIMNVIMTVPYVRVQLCWCRNRLLLPVRVLGFIARKCRRGKRSLTIALFGIPINSSLITRCTMIRTANLGRQADGYLKDSRLGTRLSRTTPRFLSEMTAQRKERRQRRFEWRLMRCMTRFRLVAVTIADTFDDGVV